MRSGLSGGQRGEGNGERSNSLSMDPQKVRDLSAFVQLCKGNPAVLHMPELRIFREWLER